MIVEPWGQPPTLAVHEHRITPTPSGQNREQTTESDQSPRQASRKKKKVPTPEGSSFNDGLWEQTWPLTANEFEEEVIPSPSMRKIFTRLPVRRLLTPGGGAFEISGQAGPSSQSKAGTATKKHRTT